MHLAHGTELMFKLITRIKYVTHLIVLLLNFWHVLRVKMPLHVCRRYAHRCKQLPTILASRSIPTFHGQQWTEGNMMMMIMNKESNWPYYVTSQLLKSSRTVFTSGKEQYEVLDWNKQIGFSAARPGCRSVTECWRNPSDRSLFNAHTPTVLPFSRPFKTCQLKPIVPVRKRSGTQFSRTIMNRAFHDMKRQTKSFNVPLGFNDSHVFDTRGLKV